MPETQSRNSLRSLKIDCFETPETVSGSVSGTFLEPGAGDSLETISGLVSQASWKKGKDPHPQDKIQHLDFTKDPRPLYYKTPPCVFYHKTVCSKAIFGP